MAIRSLPDRAGGWTEFQGKAREFVEAAARNDPETMKQAGHDMVMSGKYPLNVREQATQAAYIEAAKSNALGAMMWLHGDDRKMHNLSERAGVIGAAFVNACRADSFAVARFIDNVAEISDADKAWALYRAPTQCKTRDWLTETAGEPVAVLYEKQRAVVDRAVAGGEGLAEAVSALKESGNMPHVFREAADLSIRAGQRGSVQTLLPNIPWNGLPDLARVAGEASQPAIAEDIISRATKIYEQLSYSLYTSYGLLGETRTDIRETAYQEQKERLSEDKMRTTAVTAAATAGHLETVKALAHPEYRSLMIAASLAAARADQAEVLGYTARGIERDDSGPNGGRALPQILAAAMEHGLGATATRLLDLKGGACLDHDMLEDLVKKDDRGTFDALAARGLPPRDAGFALIRLISPRAETPGPARIPSHYIEALFAQADPDQQAKACEYLGLSNRTDVLANLETRHGPFPQNQIDSAFAGGAWATTGDAAFNTYVGRASQQAKEKIYDAIVESRDNIDRSRFLVPLIDAGVTDPDRLVLGAKVATYRETPNNEDLQGWQRWVGPSPVAVGILQHPAFSKDRANEVLVSIADGRNETAIQAAIGIGGSRMIADFHAAAARRDIPGILAVAPHVPDETVRETTTTAIFVANASLATALIEAVPQKLDLGDLISCALRAPGEEQAEVIIPAAIRQGAPVLASHFQAVVGRQNAPVLIEALLAAPGTSAAAQQGLAEAGREALENAAWESKDHQALRTRNMAHLRARLNGPAA